jgi:hypothetical protein
MKELFGVLLGIFKGAKAFETDAEFDILLQFINEVCDGYQSNPYHSFQHAVDVTYMTFLFLMDMGIQKRARLSQLHVVSILVAALGHDVLHPGLSNLFQVI